MAPENTLTISLLRGLADPSEAISKRVFDFWDNHLSDKTSERLSQLFG
jgi:hypothetical protein